MKASIFLSLLFLIISLISNSQNVPRFAKYPILETGYSAYFPADPGDFDVQTSEDGLVMYIGEADFDTANYGLILVMLGDTYADASKEELENLITSYLDFLQGQFSITGAAGYGKGHTMESHPEAVGVIDYWEDADGLQYSVKAWADENALAVLVVSSKYEVNLNYVSLFLDGFRFK